MRRLIRLLHYIRRYIPQLLLSLPLAAGVGAADAFRLLLIGPILDRVLRPDAGSHDIVLARLPGTSYALYLQQFVPAHFKNAWTMVAFALVMATLIKGICDYASTYLVYYAGFGLITDLRNDLYNAILRRSAGFFARYSTGTLLSTIVNDVERVQVAMGTVLAECMQQVFVLLFTVYIVIALGGKLAWVLLLFVPFIVVSAGRIGRRVRHTTRRGQDKLADVQNILHETIAGNRIVKAFGTELWESLRFHGASRRLFRANMHSVRAVALSSPLMDLFGAAAVALLLLLGRDRINHQVFTPGTFLAFLFAIFKLYDPVRKFALYNNSFQQALGASATLFSFMDEKDDVHEKPHAATLPNFSRSVCFEHVTFSYGVNGEGDREVLRNIDLEVRKGEVLAIVGSSGAGKSTLAHLIPRFFDVTGGRILIDGHDVRDVTLASLRRQIGIVTQETILFNDTVHNNIAYGQPHVSNHAVIAAAQAALAHDFIQKLPDGYDTTIGERGLLLSGGERQRIAIARALLKNAPILILDEATSALDSESEALVQSALQNLMVGRTVFVIAHRLSTVRRADRIVVLENGQITDTGTHEDLLSRLGTYRRLYDLQFLDVEQYKIAAGPES
ncbi:MAG TPA: ABC transporter ATP-binding protein [Terriglobales bacterium]|nr:ABC transporter ATP-binding protein [Terriglobales bacterium]